MLTRRWLSEEWRLTRKYAFAWDFWVGIAVFVIAATAASYCADLRKSSDLFNMTTTIGVAILAVVIAAISILTVFLTEEYGILLREKYANVSEVFYPYRLVASISCATVAVSVLGLFIWEAAGDSLRAVLLGASLGLTTWAVFGAFDLVRITAGHGGIKMRLPEIQEAYDEARAKRDAERNK